MTTEFLQRGGLRWGKSHWSGMNVTWPFATLRASQERITITVRTFGFLDADIEFNRSDIFRIKKKRGIPLLNVGIIIEHCKQNCAPYVLFWTMSYSTLKSGLLGAGYEVDES
jgi:hypothetical protein